ncbi:MAG TPA: helix-turn-helix domain-containing protein [Bacteroidia bacterium]
MNYQTFEPHPDLSALVKCYWTLEIPEQKDAQKQLILPDGCMDMIFNLDADIKRYTSESTFIIQPKAMILGQISDTFFVEPTGSVHSFGIRFFPYGFMSLTQLDLKHLSNKETPLNEIFGEMIASDLSRQITASNNTSERIEVIERFLRNQISKDSTIESTLKQTIDLMILSKGSKRVGDISKTYVNDRRQLERSFRKNIGISPKQFCKVIRLQAALSLLLNDETDQLTRVAYECQYFDQAHFTKDFKEFTGINPSEFKFAEHLQLSSLFYKKG